MPVDERDTKYVAIAKAIWSNLRSDHLCDMLLREFFYNDNYDREENEKREEAFDSEVELDIARILFDTLK